MIQRFRSVSLLLWSTPGCLATVRPYFRKKAMLPQFRKDALRVCAHS